MTVSPCAGCDGYAAIGNMGLFMTWEAWLTLITVLLVLLALGFNLAAADVLFLGGLVLLVTAGSLFHLFTGQTSTLPTPEQVVTGFGNEGLVTVGVLYIVVTGLVQTGAMTMITQPLLGRPRTVFGAQARIIGPVMGLSAFLNNTPVVAMFMPVIDDLCKKTRIIPSKLFIPLSYAAILGGACTLIGTSTNLVVHGLLKAQNGRGLGMWDITWVGVPCAIAGAVYLLTCARWLLPQRQSAIHRGEDPRQYTVEMLVEAGSALEGQTIEQAGLRHLPGLYLAEIEREGQVMVAVGPHQKLRGHDRLLFVGVVESVVDLQKVRGLLPATDQVFKLDAPRGDRCLIEAVVSDSCPVAGKTIRAGRFRSIYNAAVIAVARNGERIHKKIGDIVLRPGDTLLMEAHPSFADQQRNTRDFFLVGRVEGSTPPRHERAWLSMAILAVMVIVAGFEWLSMLNAALVAGGLMVATGCCTANEARRSIDWEVLLVIGAAVGISKAMQTTGVADGLAHNVIGIAGNHPLLVLILMYGVTTVLTEVMSNNAAAAIMFPIAMSTAAALGVSFMPFLMAIMIAASAAFATPIGYQTNLMVYGPGGYRFSDYLRVGIPLDLLIMIVALTVIPLVWGFHG